MKTFDLSELEKFNGKDDAPVYIAHDGAVYDVSQSKLWRGGRHMKRHQAGGDLTADLQAAPHGTEVLERYPRIGELKKEAVPEPEMPALLAELITRFPMLRRHPHPMTVHFPIVFAFSSTVFSLLYLITGVQAFETTAFHSLGAGVLFTVVALVTGYYTWWLNYMSQPMRAVTVKLRLGLLMLAVEIVAFSWRFLVPDVISPVTGAGYIYLALVCSLAVIVTVIGWHGAHLTFPTE